MGVRINFAPWSPWSEAKAKGNTTILDGIAKDLYDSMGRSYNLKFIVRLQKDLTFGALDANGEWTGMIGAMRRNETDLSGPFFVNEERANAVNFSVPIGFSQLAIMSGLVPANREPLLIFRIFTLQMWLFIVLSAILASATATLIYSVHSSPTFHKSKKDAFFKYTWSFYSTLLGKEFGSSRRWFLEYVLPAVSFRLLLYIWFLGPGLVIMYTYQGAITSTFAADKLKPKIQSLDELHENKDVIPSTFKNSYPLICFQHLKGTYLEPLIQRVQSNLKTPPLDYIPDWLDDVEDGKLAFVADVITMKAMISGRFQKKGRCGIYISPIDFCSAYISFAFRENFRPKLQQKFNKRVLWFSEGHLYQRRMLASLADYDICTRTSSSTVKALELSDLLGAYVVYFSGIGISLIVFFIEITVKYCKKRSK